ncbi:tryptophan halogenase family protein [Aestuariibacter salexigens]|uniref:tryptophan halogenase family protein n=1 Tax=Aestuariibacter salexigens TaxID=226010 RepID=UPI000417CE6E|nr:tryptophan halogenase family protein [Aestuariibacter salexigens]
MADRSDAARKQIVIIGGGTAGWMAATLMQHHLGPQGFAITLIESPQIGIIGVGEGSTPQLRQFFDTLGIAESEWMPACNATYKNGIRFEGWGHRAESDHYFHPFPSLPDRQTAGLFLQHCFQRRQGIDVHAHPDAFFLAAHLAEHRLSPLSHEGQYLGVSYAYHFDSALLGQFLGKIARSRGIRHIQANVTEVQCHTSGAISAVQLDSGEDLQAELFVDCSGFRGLLIQQALHEPFVPFADNLFNDSAIAIPSAVEPCPGTQTSSVAMQAGWRWHIPLTSRVGNGYVYSSSYISADQAETELRSELGLLDSDVEARHLKMKVGRLANHWVKNCLAVGLSQGFIEPLEATALHLVQETISSFCSAFIAGQCSALHRDEFNQRINARFEGIRDYIVCHYKVNGKEGQYWQDNRDNTLLSDNLQAVLDSWQRGQDITQTINSRNMAQYYPSVSWHCLLAGYGVFPTPNSPPPANAVQLKQQVAQAIAEMAKRFAHQADVLIATSA